MKRLAYLTVAVVLFLSKTAAAQITSSFADLVERLQPMVVNISSTHAPEDMDNGNDDLDIVSPNWQIQNYFAPRKQRQMSLGSGFVIDESGYIITNNHVIDKAKQISVTLADDRQFEAKIIGADPKTDLALIKIDTQDKLPTVTLGDSDKIRVGDWIVAIGNPFGLGGSVTAGIVSAKSRDIEDGSYDNFIQTDASINQGSSGGPMFNTEGEVIGINSAIYSTTGGSMGIGFATPINLAKFVIKELKSKGKVERGWLGVKIQTANTDGNLIITSVAPNSPARKAEIEPGDIITALNGYPIADPKLFSRNIAETAVGTNIKLKIERNGKIFDKELKLELMPEKTSTTPQTEKPQDNAPELEFANITPDLVNQYQLEPNSRGVVVVNVKSGSDAEIKGIKRGDLISEIDKRPVFDIKDAQSALDDAKRENNRPVLFLINNRNIPYYAAVRP